MTDAKGLGAVDQRNVGDDALDARFDGSEDQHVPAAVGNAPDADAIGINLRQRFSEGDGVAVILDLQPRVGVLTGRAVAFAEVLVVEHETGDASLSEEFRIFRHHDFFCVAPAARHHEQWKRPLGVVWKLEEPPTSDTLALEFDRLDDDFAHDVLSTGLLVNQINLLKYSTPKHGTLSLPSLRPGLGARRLDQGARSAAPRDDRAFRSA
jgi:hypothetical protein